MPTPNQVMERMARGVFGAARGESKEGKLAVAHAINNRVKHPGYPNIHAAVMNATYRGKGYKMHEFNTFDNRRHDEAFELAKSGGPGHQEYLSSLEAAADVYFGRVKDNTGGATQFDAARNSSALQDSKYYHMKYTGQVGGHYFATAVKKP